MVVIQQHFAAVKKLLIKKKRAENNQPVVFLRSARLTLSSFFPVSGNHHDLYQIEKAIDELVETLFVAKIPVNGLFINADVGFDAENFRLTCFRYGIVVNVAFNKRNGSFNDEYLLDETLYKERYSIERTNAWMDSFRYLLNRFDFTTSSCLSFNYISFMVILLKKVYKRKKSK